MVKCPWCGDEVDADEYSDHLQEEHYEEKDGKLIGPYTKKKAERS